MQQIILVFLGGGLGSVCRYALGRWVLSQWGTLLFPWATFAANLLGSFLIAYLLTLSMHVTQSNPRLTLLLTTGFCGGFTTFSTFAYESSTLLEKSNFWLPWLYMGCSIFGGLLAVYLGVWLAGGKPQ